MLSDHPWFKIGEAIHFPCSYSRLVNYHEALEYVPTEKILAQAELEFASAATAMQAVGFAHELRALHMRNVGPTKEIVGTVKTFTCDESPFADTSVEVDGWRLRVVINTSGWSCTAEAIDGSETVKAEVISQVADPKNFVRHHGDGWATSEHRYTVTLKAQVPTRTYAQRMQSAGLAHLLQKSAMILVSNLN